MFSFSLAAMQARGLINFLLTGICLNSDFDSAKRNTTVKREAESLSSEDHLLPEDVCLLPNHNVLLGRKLKIATWEDWPASYTSKDEKGNLVGHGFAFEFVEVLRQKYGFTYEVVKPEENVLGDEKQGLLGMLYNKTVDMVAALMPLTYSTMRLATPSLPLGETEFVVLMKRPDASASGSGLLAPFTTVVWILILVSLVAVGPIIYLIIKLRNRLLCSRRPLLVPAETNEPIREIYPMSACVWFVYGALMKQGSTLSPRSDSTRLLFATWWLFILVLTAYYTANLTAFLTLSKFTLPINDAKDISEKRLRWFAERGRLMQTAVSEEHEAVETLQKNLLVSDHFYDLPSDNKTRAATILTSIVDRGLVYLEERSKVEYLIFRQYVDRTKMGKTEAERCQLAYTPTSFMVMTLGFFYPNGSVLHKLFQPTLMSIMEAGIVKYQQQMILPLNQICPLNLGNKERQLRNADLKTTYIVIASGFTAGVVAFIGELATQRWFRKRARERSQNSQRKLLGSSMDPLHMERKRVRLKIPVQPRYPGDHLSHVLVMPNGKGGPKTHYIPGRSSADFIFS